MTSILHFSSSIDLVGDSLALDLSEVSIKAKVQRLGKGKKKCVTAFSPITVFLHLSLLIQIDHAYFFSAVAFNHCNAIEKYWHFSGNAI